MRRTPSKKRELIRRFDVIVFIAFLFLSQLVALAMHRLDYPVVDDWRYYQPGLEMPQVFSFDWLVAPARDTLHVTGKLVDWLVFRFLSHDYHLLAALSFALAVGGWLSCAVAVVLSVGRGDRVVSLASLLVFCLPLAGVPYWVTVSSQQWLEPAVAYHQMLPVLGLAALSFLCLSERARNPRKWRGFVAIGLTAFFSLAYSSGALTLFIFGATLLSLSVLAPRESESSLRAPLGLAISLTAGACLALHVLVPILSLDFNPLTEARDHQLTSPANPIFWHFFLALFDRSVLSTAAGWASRLRGVAVLSFVVVPAVGLGVLVLRGRLSGWRRSAAAVVVASSVAVVAYAALITYGRASFGAFYFIERHSPEAQAALYAKSRFFFWWITALLPVFLAGTGLLLERLASLRTTRVVVVLLAALLLWPKPQDRETSSYFRHWSYGALYARDARQLSDLIERDVVRSRGGRRFAAESHKWLSLPPETRNPSYRRHGQWEEFAARAFQYRRARSIGATFVDRWDLLGPDD